GGFWSDMNRLQAEMNRLFDRFGFEDGRRPIAPSYPALNMWRDADNLYIEAELPGIEMKDLDIQVSGGNQLSLKGKREAPAEEKGTWHRQERGYGTFTRAMTLPEEVDVDQVKAEFKDGVLCVTLPKSEKAKPRRIEVKAS
ncbi:MAG: Hsp20/alpha crystallin family protein, partial [Pirellulales bacterium]|nr:Hsp20/alpha crystallin family protein [Pirellulales bacterium]